MQQSPTLPVMLACRTPRGSIFAVASRDYLLLALTNQPLAALWESSSLWHLNCEENFNGVKLNVVEPYTPPRPCRHSYRVSHFDDHMGGDVLLRACPERISINNYLALSHTFEMTILHLV